MSTTEAPGRAKTAADFPVGATITTRGRTITEFDVASFAALTWDSYPLHTDEEWSKSSPFGERIAGGPLTFSYAVGLMCVSNWYEDAIVAFLGAKDMQLLGPVKIGDTIKVSVEVLENRPASKSGRAVVTTKYTVLNQRDEAVLTMEPTFLMNA